MDTLTSADFFTADRMSLVRRASAFAQLGEGDMRALNELTARPPDVFHPNQLLLEAGRPFRTGYVLVSGWAMWHEDLPDGSRQIFDFLLPGDVIGLSALVLARALRQHGGGDSDAVAAPFSVTALTDLRAVPVCSEALDRLFERRPELGTLMLALTATQESAHMRRRLTNTGHRQARAQVADLLFDLWQRLRAAELADGAQFELPVTQAMLGEVLGLTHVHISRTLTGLERDGILSIASKPRRRVVFHDPDALRAVADIPARVSKGPVRTRRTRTSAGPLQRAES